MYVACGSVCINTDHTDEALTVHEYVCRGSVGINTDHTNEALTVHKYVCSL